MNTKSYKRIEEEKRTVEAMVRIYCRGVHGNSKICNNCKELLDYAFSRLDKCPQTASKPTCAQCTIHCYRPAMKDGIITVMRYAGPRMLLYHPIKAMRHLWRTTINKPPHPPTNTVE